MVDKSILLRTAELAKLKFTEEELSKFSREFSSIIDMVDRLSSLACENVEGFAHSGAKIAPMRGDQAESQGHDFFAGRENNTMADLASQKQCFVVPKILDVS